MEKTTAIKKERAAGIELFRIVSMLMVLVLHILGQGGVLSSSWGRMQYDTGWMLEIGAFGAVDCFALISGYVGWRAKFRPSKLVDLWLRILSVSLLWTVLFAVISPEKITQTLIETVFVPITNREYWYMTAYFGMFLLMPALNAAVQNIPKKTSSVMLVLITVMFSVVPTFTGSTPYTLNGGYSMVWLCVVYLFGGYFARFEIPNKLPKWMWLLIYFGFTAVAVGFKHKFHNLSPTLGSMFIDYTSPTVFLGSLGLLGFFASLDIRAGWLKKTIGTFSVCSLGVYLIHLYPIVWDDYVKNRFVNYAGFAPLKLALAVLGTACAVYLACSVLEWVRIGVFKVTRLEKLIRLTDRLMPKEDEDRPQAENRV